MNAPPEAERGGAGLLVCEREWIKRCNALEKLAEELIEVLDSEGYLYVNIWRARLRDLTEDE